MRATDTWIFRPRIVYLFTYFGQNLSKNLLFGQTVHRFKFAMSVTENYNLSLNFPVKLIIFPIIQVYNLQQNKCYP